MDDLYSIFGDPFFEVVRSDFLKKDFDEGDLKVKDYVMSFYTNFALTGYVIIVNIRFRPNYASTIRWFLRI
jgi:hypothetical protein